MQNGSQDTFCPGAPSSERHPSVTQHFFPCVNPTPNLACSPRVGIFALLISSGASQIILIGHWRSICSGRERARRKKSWTGWWWNVHKQKCRSLAASSLFWMVSTWCLLAIPVACWPIKHSAWGESCALSGWEGGEEKDRETKSWKSFVNQECKTAVKVAIKQMQIRVDSLPGTIQIHLAHHTTINNSLCQLQSGDDMCRVHYLLQKVRTNFFCCIWQKKSLLQLVVLIQYTIFLNNIAG
jgi:hypothetical protein